MLEGIEPIWCLLINDINNQIMNILGYERVYLPLYKVADTPFYVQGDWI